MLAWIVELIASLPEFRWKKKEELKMELSANVA